MPSMSICPLCTSAETFLRDTDAVREYRQCRECQLVYVPEKFFLTAAKERAVYDQHQNSVDDLRYRAFLDRLVQPLAALLPDASCGLDFGCGPGPALAAMLTEGGHTVRLFDPYYARHPSVFERTYDFITATEVFEHLYRPSFEIDRLWNCLKPGGYLGIMTKRVPQLTTFSDWFYTRDPTHVVFFSDHTFQWLGRFLHADVQLPAEDVAILKKSTAISDASTT